MKYIVETQTEKDEGIWKPLQVGVTSENSVSDSLSLFDETDTAKYYINWKAAQLVKVRVMDDLSDAM